MFDFFRGFTRVVTLGILNPDKEGKLTFKDPFTGLLDITKNISDVVFRDEDKGVWLGIRNIGDNFLGVSSVALRVLNYDIVHQAVMVDGCAFSLCNDKGGDIRIK